MDEEMLKSIASQLRKPSGEQAAQIGEKMNQGNLQINMNTIEVLAPTANDNILEIGMGNGFFVKDILGFDNTIRYTGCDFSEVMVEEAGKINKSFIDSKKAEFYLANAEDLPFAPETFNKVFTVNTIYFWEDKELVLSEIRRVLKPHGQIIISIRPATVMQHYPFAKYGFEMFNQEDLTSLLSENGYTVTAVIEKEEPSQELNGEMIKVETLVVQAQKS